MIVLFAFSGCWTRQAGSVGSDIYVESLKPKDYDKKTDKVVEKVDTRPVAEIQEETNLHILMLGQAIEHYIMDSSTIGSPKAADIDVLKSLIQSAKIKLEDKFYSDGWGKAFIYECDPVIGSRNYTIISCGADGKPGPEPAKRGVVAKPEEDIIWANGTFYQRTQGHMKPNK